MGGFTSGGSSTMQMGVMAASTAAKMAEAKAEQDSQTAALQDSYAHQVEVLQRQQARETKQREDLLRRAVATQRARLGALGVGSGTGSSEALVNGLQQRSADEIADLGEEYGDRISTLGLNISRQLDQTAEQGRRRMFGL